MSIQRTAGDYSQNTTKSFNRIEQSSNTQQVSALNKTSFVQFRISRHYSELKQIAQVVFEQKAIERPTVAALARWCLYTHDTMDGLLSNGHHP
jgi:hypothetical protein